MNIRPRGHAGGKGKGEAESNLWVLRPGHGKADRRDLLGTRLEQSKQVPQAPDPLIRKRKSNQKRKWNPLTRLIIGIRKKKGE